VRRLFSGPSDGWQSSGQGRAEFAATPVVASNGMQGRVPEGSAWDEQRKAASLLLSATTEFWNVTDRKTPLRCRAMPL
jgi:hypothetical protein